MERKRPPERRINISAPPLVRCGDICLIPSYHRPVDRAFVEAVKQDGIGTCQTTDGLRGGRRPRTVRAAALPIRSLINYLVETDQLDASPIHSVRLPKKDPAERPQVTDEELLALVAGCERMAGTERPVMARAMLLTLATTAA